MCANKVWIQFLDYLKFILHNLFVSWQFLIQQLENWGMTLKHSQDKNLHVLEGGRKREEDKQSWGQTDKKRLSQYSISQMQLLSNRAVDSYPTQKERWTPEKSSLISTLNNIQWSIKTIHTLYSFRTIIDIFDADD